MKTIQHKIGLIAKKCVELRLNGIADAFFDYHPHVDKISIYVTKINNYDIAIYRGSCYLDGCFNCSDDATNVDSILECLDSIMHGLGVE